MRRCWSGPLPLPVPLTGRLIVSKLDAAAYTRFTNHILTKGASEVCFDYTAKDGQSTTWNGRAHRRHSRTAELLGVDLWSPCPGRRWYSRPCSTENEMEDNAQTKLKKLSVEIQLNIKQDAKVLGCPPALPQPEVGVVSAKKNRT
ncbi:unnamed protein product [Toxocara canis]|uniref:Mitochondrial inner membrane protease subunit 2 n=1 Tax=Toxocara canis TaxID=6265 RepID=A0A183UUP2_TOXCA|nr:unnamed protein product [Toxocara canis]